MNDKNPLRGRFQWAESNMPAAVQRNLQKGCVTNVLAYFNSSDEYLKGRVSNADTDEG